MDAREMVAASLKQSRAYLDRALDGLSQEDVAWQPGEECNSIAFIAWHTARIEDFFFGRVIQRQGQVYEEQGWQEKLGTPPIDSGFGYSVEQVKDWPVPKLEDLIGYIDAVRTNTLSLLDKLTPEEMLEPVRSDRPDTIGGLLSRVATEMALHMGQIDYIRGIRRGFVTAEGV